MHGPASRMGARARLPGAMLWVTACISPTPIEESTGARILADNGIQLDNGLDLPNGFRLANGVRLANGIRLSNGLQVTNGVLAPNGIDIGNGIRLTNGIRLSNGVVLTGDVDGPYIAPAEDSDLAAWLDSNLENNLRVLRYMIGCALDGATVVVVQHRDQQYRFSGQVALGESWRLGEMTAIDQEGVSACLMARINVRGELLTIDLGGPFPGMSDRSVDEADAYRWREATFFGNLFLDTPHARVCSTTMSACLSRLCLRADGSCDCGLIPNVGTAGRFAACQDTGGWLGTFCDGVSSESPTTACREYLYGTPDVRWLAPVTVWTARAPNGEACGSPDDCIVGVCDDGVCGKGTGAACSHGSECSLLECSGGVCGGPGARCASDAGCQYGNCRTSTVPGLCGGPRLSSAGTGAACTASAECSTAYCRRGECLRCSRDDECGGGVCWYGSCV